MKRQIGAILFLFSFGLAWYVYAKTSIEQANYITDLKVDEIELRHYPKLVLATTEMSGRRGNEAFMRLFRYISGENYDDQKMEMTAPVIMDEYRSKKMAFVLPGSISLEEIPQPLSAYVELKIIDSYNVAAIQFRGLMTPSAIHKHKTLLFEWMNNSDIEPAGEVLVAGYNHPATPPILRRNEVLIPYRVRGEHF